LVDIVKILTQSFTNIQAIIIGNFSDENTKNEIVKKVKDLKLEDNIIIHDPVPFSRIKNYYEKSKIGICALYPNKKFLQAIPIKIFEYMAFGLPVIFSNKGVATKFITEYNTGILVNSYVPEQIAEAVLSLLNNENYYRELSANGKKAIIEKYSWHNEEQKLLNVYRQIFS
jgi:glycosyltransferase involved in cell wall biosynthesis